MRTQSGRAPDSVADRRSDSALSVRSLTSRLRQVAVLVAVTATWPLAACSAGDGPSEPSASSIASHPLAKIEAAPAMVPTLTVDGQPISPAYVEWRDSGELVTSRAAPDQDDVVLPKVTAGSSTLRLEFDSDVAAAQLYVTFFAELDERGVPLDAEGDEIDCLRTSSRCKVELGGGRMILSVIRPEGSPLMVVHLAYFTDSVDAADPDPDRGLELDAASWGVRFA